MTSSNSAIFHRMEFVICTKLFVKCARLADHFSLSTALFLINEGRLFIKKHCGLSSSPFPYLVFVSAAAENHRWRVTATLSSTAPPNHPIPQPAVRVVFLHCRLGTDMEWQSHWKLLMCVCVCKGRATVNVRFRMGRSLLLSDKPSGEKKKKRQACELPGIGCVAARWEC